MLGSEGVGKLSMSTLGDSKKDDAMLDWEGWAGSELLQALLSVERY
jgi:hypothetical protein